MPPKVSVVMPCTGRSVARDSIESVLRQSLADLELIIVIDPWCGCAPLPRAWTSDERVRVEEPRWQDRSEYLPARIARLRNFGLRCAVGKYVAHLDDDNWWSSEHLQTLCTILDGNPTLGFAHSWRIVVDEAGMPVPLSTYPWSTRFGNHDQIFSKFLAYGLVARGEPFLRDAVVSDTGDEIFHVDTSELCIRTEVHQRFPFREQFTLRQVIEGCGEDRVICEEFHRAGIATRTSGMYTLFYRLGGYSNRASAPTPVR